MVAAPLALAAVDRRAVADRDERVLERRPRRHVCVGVAGRDRLHPKRLGEVAKRGVAAGVAALVRPLELDEEAVAPERLREPRRRVRVAHGKPGARAAGEAHEPLVQLLEATLLERRRQQLVLAAGKTRTRMRRRQQAAQVRVSRRRLREQRHMRAVGQRDLRARDRPDAERLRRVRELERSVDAVVVGERERSVPELGRANDQLLGQRRTVEEGVRRMRSAART